MLIKVSNHRVWILSRRIHHFWVGAVFVILGLWVMWDDKKDFPWKMDKLL